jgi:hypothetical protein
MRSLDGYRASPKGAGTSKKILARKFGYEHSLPFIIGSEGEKVTDGSPPDLWLEGAIEVHMRVRDKRATP